MAIMTSGGKKINVPSIDDIDEFIGREPCAEICSHFQPGKIIQAAKAEECKDAAAKLKTATSKTCLPSVEKSDQETKSKTALQGTGNVTYSACESEGLKQDSTLGTGPTSRFEDAFSHLKQSKYYEAPPVQSEITIGAGAKPLSSVIGKTNCVIVSSRQRGNPLLKHIRNVPWEYGEIEPDYIMGQTTCALFLSLRYHNLFPNYIHDRLKSLGKTYELQVILVQVDVKDPHPAIRDLSRIAILADCTLMLAWSPEEAGYYIETYKIFENKSADLIMEKQDVDKYAQLVEFLAIKSVNRTDAMTLLSSFGTLKKIIEASPEQLSLCPGMGPHKASKLHEILHQPFLKSSR